jgi:hypothetical protein
MSALSFAAQAFRRWSGMRRITRLAAVGTDDALVEFAKGCGEPELRQLAQGAYGRRLFYQSRQKEATAQFSGLRALVKGRDDRRSGYINIFCLCYLSLLRGTAGYNDAAMFAKRARNFRPRPALRRILAMPDLPERVFPGGVAMMMADPAPARRGEPLVARRSQAP